MVVVWPFSYEVFMEVSSTVHKKSTQRQLTPNTYQYSQLLMHVSLQNKLLLYSNVSNVISYFETSWSKEVIKEAPNLVM